MRIKCFLILGMCMTPTRMKQTKKTTVPSEKKTHTIRAKRETKIKTQKKRERKKNQMSAKRSQTGQSRTKCLKCYEFGRATLIRVTDRKYQFHRIYVFSRFQLCRLYCIQLSQYVSNNTISRIEQRHHSCKRQINILASVRVRVCV